MSKKGYISEDDWEVVGDAGFISKLGHNVELTAWVMGENGDFVTFRKFSSQDEWDQFVRGCRLMPPSPFSWGGK